MIAKEENDKAIETIKSYKQNGSYDEDVASYLAENMEMADNEDNFRVALIALYKYVIEDLRP